MKRNAFRIRKPDLDLILARLNLAAFCAAIGSEFVTEGTLRNDIREIITLAKKQTFRDGKRHGIRPSPSTGEGEAGASK